jgi:hypothetical protein
MICFLLIRGFSFLFCKLLAYVSSLRIAWDVPDGTNPEEFEKVMQRVVAILRLKRPQQGTPQSTSTPMSTSNS